uniref:Uncharacterized protein n=1 Tax=Cacopsylla melanoneura TaxID=428564 RepID=A0A8D9AAU6_9HEMI
MFFIRCRFFSEVHQKFLVTGHSFLPCDRDFALIEREKKKTKLMVPSQILIGASNEKSPFIITEMQQADFKDLDLMAAALLRDNNDDVSSVYARETHDVTRPWKSYNIFKPEETELTELNLPRLYTRPIPVEREKKKNLENMVQYMRNRQHRQFYANLPSCFLATYTYHFRFFQFST